MFENFTQSHITVGDYGIDVLSGGNGPPLLLLHGYPQTRAIWHAVAPVLAEHFTLIVPDLPGYGRSTGPEPDEQNLHYSKRVVGGVMVALMASLGHERFCLAGHDRGGRVAYRLALDHGACVERIALLDIVPTVAVWEEMDWQTAIGAFHWPLLAQPAPVPETLIGANPAFYVEHLLERWAVHRDALSPEAVGDYVGQFSNPSVVAATCADYRAGATVDVEHDRADLAAGRRITCPGLVLWAEGYSSTTSASPLDVWRHWFDNVKDQSFDCGHFVAEERAGPCANAMADFFTAS
jgi:haloacetate dehalogenase